MAVSRMQEPFDSVVQQALQSWENISASSSESNKRTSREMLTDFRTGQDVDDLMYELLRKTVPTKLLLPSAHVASESTVMTYNSFIVDVPPDGNCGFHALQRASMVYGGTTALGADLPGTVDEVRGLMVSFLRHDRVKIERALIQSINESQSSSTGENIARHVIWRDISCLPESMNQPGTQPLFEEFCTSLTRSGMSGHWLGSMLGEIELHLLARCLGVIAFSVRAGIKDGEGHLLHGLLRQEGTPFTFLWKGEMYYPPKGAVVIRFLGHTRHGHFQIVRCGVHNSNFHARGTKRKMSNGTKPSSNRRKPTSDRKKPNATKNKPAAKEKKRSPGFMEDVEAVKSMHGVQRQTARRYFANTRLIQEAFSDLADEGKDPLQLEIYGRHVLDTIMGLLMQRCGPKSEDYEGLSAQSTGRALLAAVGRWYNQKGYHFSNQQTCVVKGTSVYGPPWKADEVLRFRSVLQKQQAKARSNPIKRAYQLTHDDIAEAMRKYVADQLGEALSPSYPPGRNPNVDWLNLQTTLMAIASFGSGCRGAELVNIRLGELAFLANTADTTIGAVLYGTKSRSGAKAIQRIVFPSWKETLTISPSHAVLMQLALVHGLQLGASNEEELSERPLFPSIVRNQPQIGSQMKSGAYSGAIKDLFKSLGITDKATEHSPRRGGCGFRYFVLNEDPSYIRDVLGHANIQETITYIGFSDKKNSYVSQGYSSCSAGRIR